MAIAAVVPQRRRPGSPEGDPAVVAPPWIPPAVAADARARDVLMEAELQEMVSEERARALGERADADMPLAPT